MNKWLPIALLAVLAMASAVGAQSEEQYDEWAESPTVEIEGCGILPAVRVIVAGHETEYRGFIRSGRAYLAARETLEQLGGQVTWVRDERSFYAQFPEQGRTLKVTLDSRIATIYKHDPQSRYGAGSQMGRARISASPIICGGRIFVPVRAAVDLAGGTARYDAGSRTVYVDPPPEARQR